MTSRPLGRVFFFASLWLIGCAPLIFLVRGALDAHANASEKHWLVWRVLSDGDTWMALLRTLSLSLSVGVVCTLLALPLAWWTHTTDLPWRRFFRTAFTLPLAIPSYVSGVVVLAASASLTRSGTHIAGIAGIFGIFGIDNIYGGVGAFLALLFSFPFAYLTLQSALTRLDPRLWEAARSLGASPRVAFRRVILPELRPAIMRAVLLVTLYAAGDFGAVALLRYRSLSYLIYLRYKSLFGRDEAILLALLLAALACLLVAALLRLGGAHPRALRTDGSARPWPTLPLRRWRIPAWVFSCLVVLVSLVIPLGIVGSWLVHGVQLGHTFASPTWFATAFSISSTSLWVAGLGAAIVLVLALCPALFVRFWGTALQHKTLHLVSHLGYALPGIVVALAFVSFGVRWPDTLYHTFPLLFFAYAIRFLPLALHVIDDALSAQSTHLFQAARSLGKSPLSALTRVVLPTVRPALLLGFIAVFIAVLKELPITLLVRPIGVDTLATHIWALTQDAYFSEVAPIVFVLVAFAAIALSLQPKSPSSKTP